MWYYRDKEFKSEDIGDNYAFVYIIENCVEDKFYIGKKLFWSKKTKQIKGKKKRYKVESDWKNYWGSNDELKADISRLGKDKFIRKILQLCKSKGTANYYEAKEIFLQDAILSDKFYNQWIMVRVARSHIK
jgi:hypothetical protein